MKFLLKLLTYISTLKTYIKNFFIHPDIMKPYSIKVNKNYTNPVLTHSILHTKKNYKYSLVSIIQLPLVEAVTLISLTKISNSTSLLKIALFFQGKILSTSDNDFVVIINNVILRPAKADIVTSISNNHIVQLTASIPTIYNPSNIYFLIGTNKSSNQLDTMSISKIVLLPIFPYIEGKSINPCSFNWKVYIHNVRINSILYTVNTFKYKLPTSLCIYNFGRNFALLPTDKSVVLNIKYIYSIDISMLCKLQLKIVNNFLLDSNKDLGSIYINFYLVNKNFKASIYFDNTDEITISLDDNATSISFKSFLPKDFIDSISLINCYYLPSEYLLMTSDKKSFINASFKVLTTNFEKEY